MPLRAALHLRRLFSTDPATAPPRLRNLPYRLRRVAVPAARAVVSEYLHSTRCLPSSHADSIAAHSPRSLLAFLAALPAVPGTLPTVELPALLRRYLSFNPLNELPFFLESIGAPPNAAAGAPRFDHMFLDDHPYLLGAVAALAHFGFPWSRLGLLFPAVLLGVAPDLISARLAALEARLHRLPRAAIIAACLTFPSLLEGDLSDGNPLVKDLGTAFRSLRSDLGSSNDIDAFSVVCRRMRMFYDAGAEVGSIGGLVGASRRVFLELGEERIGERLRFFKELGMEGKELGRFLLCNAGVFDPDFSDVVISVPEYLRRVGLAEDEVDAAVEKHPYVVGKNQLENLPRVLRAMELECRFLEKISVGAESLRYLSPDFVSEDDSYDVDVERAFLDGMAKVKAERKAQHVDSKLEFLKSIGYAENEIATRLIPFLHSTRDLLQERFDYLLERGVEYKILCQILSVFPKVLNQGKEMLNEKLNYLTEELGYSLEYLDCFPAFLCFDLENRTKPRYAMLRWLQEHGLLKKTLAPATVLANSEKRFITSLYIAHPAAPKLWLECFSSRIHMEYYLKNMFSQHPENK
ncbi:transcription termination factor MTEF18, mitochondrial-like [Phragmites australis]|uniref:transcription termination factor MTEF18, mitochondrial-like n=1 Tax=Phragmites australis TaxID=29695 RepID=UPI002D79EA21|nr:transcription termination factor MTEF18, mitochondrial-like [Phragmites australis]XP_062190710.1 transcription termination factor MTEF18, mitochondrial-like [Phragmites australis]